MFAVGKQARDAIPPPLRVAADKIQELCIGDRASIKKESGDVRTRLPRCGREHRREVSRTYRDALLSANARSDNKDRNAETRACGEAGHGVSVRCTGWSRRGPARGGQFPRGVSVAVVTPCAGHEWQDVRQLVLGQF